MDINRGLALLADKERHFSSVRRTSRFIENHSDAFTVLTKGSNSDRHLDDLVLHMFKPDMRIHIDNYYENSGPLLKDIYSREQIKSLDESLLEKLKSVLKKPPIIVSET